MDKLEKIKKLREETGVGVMICKKVLDKAKGNIEKAQKLIQEELKDLIKKKKEAKTGVGKLEAFIHNNRVGVLLEMRAQTDFAVKSPLFKELCHNLVMQIAAMSPENIEELMKQPFIKDESKSVREIIDETISKLKENINIQRFTRYEI